MRFDMLDYPTAWEIQNKGGLKHHPKCSSVSHAFLCDCGAVESEWRRLKENNDSKDKAS